MKLARLRQSHFDWSTAPWSPLDDYKEHFGRKTNHVKNDRSYRGRGKDHG